MAFQHYILVCGGTACMSNKADDIYKQLIRRPSSRASRRRPRS